MILIQDMIIKIIQCRNGLEINRLLPCLTLVRLLNLSFIIG